MDCLRSFYPGTLPVFAADDPATINISQNVSWREGLDDLRRATAYATVSRGHGRPAFNALHRVTIAALQPKSRNSCTSAKSKFVVSTSAG